MTLKDNLSIFRVSFASSLRVNLLVSSALILASSSLIVCTERSETLSLYSNLTTPSVINLLSYHLGAMVMLYTSNISAESASTIPVSLRYDTPEP
jgi:hypothetical protein